MSEKLSSCTPEKCLHLPSTRGIASLGMDSFLGSTLFSLRTINMLLHCLCVSSVATDAKLLLASL